MLRVADFYAANRGGGLYSEAVSQRVGAVIAAGAARMALTPTVVTLGSLVVGVASSVLLTANAGRVTVALGIVVLLGWQLAYAMDCADGQLARVTRRTSPAGARVDVLCDVAGHIALVTALVQVARPQPWLGALFAGSWMVNIVTSVLAGSAPDSLIVSKTWPVRVLKLVRDFGFIALAAGLILVCRPASMVWFLVAMCALNLAFLAVSIARAAVQSLRSDP